MARDRNLQETFNKPQMAPGPFTPAGSAACARPTTCLGKGRCGRHRSAERAAADTFALWAELQATLAEVRHRWGQIRTRASQEEQGEQAADPPGDGKAPPS
jgi:hypothetical protein